MSARTPSRAQRVAAAIEDGILAGRTAVGASLGRRTDLIEAHGVSPTVMNETLRILRDRGLVEVRPGPGGGVFVIGSPPQVRLGALDLWFSPGTQDPLGLFEARNHLEELLTTVALDRAGPEDLRDMEWAVEEMRAAREPRAFLEANMRLHLAIARAARIPVLSGTYEAVVAILRNSLARVELLPGHDEMYTHNIEVHAQIVAAIRDRDREALTKLGALHREDLVRATDPSRSPSSP
ncbi:MAG: GntR family transcriptional regulator [Pseudonocardia sp. SCN 72-86]|nr:MAG: GntR family transcriptional regulator [Pseudonocardia sp. SCN 72-86]